MELDRESSTSGESGDSSEDSESSGGELLATLTASASLKRRRAALACILYLDDTAIEPWHSSEMLLLSTQQGYYSSPAWQCRAF